jgi:hypothetical protein
MDSKKILEKLFKIASNQQKIIERLAQEVQPDADKVWLQQVAEMAAMNLNTGIAHTVSVTATPPGYTISVNNLGQKSEAFKNNVFRTVVAQNRQDLSSRINFNLT